MAKVVPGMQLGVLNASTPVTQSRQFCPSVDSFQKTTVTTTDLGLSASRSKYTEQTDHAERFD